MTIYLLPTTHQICVSYNYTSDLLYIQSHMKDCFTKISVRRGIPFKLAPMIFQQGLDLLNPKTRFKISNERFAKIWLQGTKIVKNEVHVTPFRRVISNIHSDYNVCWGGNFNGVSTMRGMLSAFFGSPFNGDLCNDEQTQDNCHYTRQEIKQGRFSKSPYTLISKDAHALYILYNSDVKDLAQFFKMSCAGFEPLSENKNIMIIPLKETLLTYENVEYRGFLTPLDNCNKKWFILPNGNIVGQYNYRTMSIREPEFAEIPTVMSSSSRSEYDEDEEEDDEE